MFGVANETSRSSISAFTRQFQMPYVTTNPPINESRYYGPPSAAVHEAFFGGPPPALAPSGSRPGGAPLVPTVPTGPGSPLLPAGSYTIYVRPRYDAAIMAIIKHYGWHNVSYIYDSNEGEYTEFAYFVKITPPSASLLSNSACL